MNTTFDETVRWHIYQSDPPPFCQSVLYFDGDYIGTGYRDKDECFCDTSRGSMENPTHWTTLQGPKQPA